MTDQTTLFDTKPPEPEWMVRMREESRRVIEKAAERVDAGCGAAHRLAKWSGRRGHRTMSLQYQVIDRFVRVGYITSEEILEHDDPHWRASAKQRIRDCRKYGLRIRTKQGPDRCTWRLDPEDLGLARRLLERAR